MKLRDKKPEIVWGLGIVTGVLMGIIWTVLLTQTDGLGILKEEFNLSNSCFLEVYTQTDNIGLKVRLLNVTVSGLKSECVHLEEACKKRGVGGLLDNFTKLECRWLPSILGNDGKEYSYCSCQF